MWGFGGRYYWGSNSSRNEQRKASMKGIVVVFAWMSSDDKHLKRYIDLYASLGWDSLICHPQFLNSFFPDKAKLLALDVLNELVEELRIQPCPVVFAAFSGGPKACMYKVLQIIEGKCEPQSNTDCYSLIKDCVAGFIYDSCPVDFISEIGSRFVVHPTVLKVPHPPKLAKWIANGISSGLDTFFSDKFESQRADYWQTLYASVSMGAPYALFCSEDDDLAPFQTIYDFSQRLKDLGGDVTLVKWESSPHVGHNRKYPDEYKTGVAQLLQKASAVYFQRVQKMEGEMISSGGSINRHLEQEDATPDKETRSASAHLANHFIIHSPPRCNEDKAMDCVSFQDESEERLIQLPSSPPSISAHGVLGEALFGVCVAKDVEDWEVKKSSSFRAPPKRPSSFNPIKCIIRSRL